MVVPDIILHHVKVALLVAVLYGEDQVGVDGVADHVDGDEYKGLVEAGHGGQPHVLVLHRLGPVQQTVNVTHGAD